MRIRYASLLMGFCAMSLLAPVSLQACMSGMLSADAGPDRTICAGSCTTLGGSPSVTCSCSASGHPFTYSWSPTTGLSNPSSPNPVACPSSTTTYMLTVTGASCGCSGMNCSCRGRTATDSVTVTVSLPVADAGADATTCGGAPALGGTVPGSGGVAPYTYSWSPSTGLSDPTSQHPLASPTTATTYALTVTDALGCQATDTVTVVPCLTGCAPRTVGYWGQQCLDQRFEDPSVHFAWIGTQSRVFDELTSPSTPCTYLLWAPDPQSPDFRFRRAVRQLAALWLNVTSGKVAMETPIALPSSLGGATSVGEALLDAETIVLASPFPDDLSLDVAKDIADVLNNGCYYYQICSEPCQLNLDLYRLKDGTVLIDWSSTGLSGYTVDISPTPDFQSPVSWTRTESFFVDTAAGGVGHYYRVTVN